MNDIKFNCPQCGTHLTVDAMGAGMTVNCPNCAKPIVIPFVQSDPRQRAAVSAPELSADKHNRAGTKRWFLLAGSAAAILVALAAVWFLVSRNSELWATKPSIEAKSAPQQPARSAAVMSAQPVSITKADEVQIQTTLREVIRTATPYNNLSELPRKLPKEFFENVEAGKLVKWVEDGFKKTPPGQNEDMRNLLFTGLDVAAIVTRQQQFAPLLKLRSQSTRNIYRLLREENVTNGLVLYKLYNEGTILRAPNTCIGIDIVLEEENKDLASGFAALLDGLLVTHRDGDHYDYASPLYAEFEKKGKPVIIPSENQSVNFGGMLTNGQIGSVKWTAFRGGHLDLRFSAFYLLQITNRWRVLHSGDNTVWMDFSKSEYAKNIDIFLLKPESTYAREGRPRGGDQEAMKETLDSIHPRLVIPHHLLELGHGLDAYGHDMGIRLHKQAPSGVKVLMLQWGETVTIP